MITITHPSVTDGTVEVSGLTFVDGKAEVAQFDDAARAVLTDHGFTFDGEPEPDKGDEQTPEAPSKAWNKDRLVEYATERSIDISEAKTKDDILALIEAAAAAQSAQNEAADEQKDASAS